MTDALFRRTEILFIAMDIDAESCLKDWDDLAQDYKELEVRFIPISSRSGGSTESRVIHEVMFHHFATPRMLQILRLAGGRKIAISASLSRDLSLTLTIVEILIGHAILIVYLCVG